MFVMCGLLWFGSDSLITITVMNSEIANEILGVIVVVAIPTALLVLVNIKTLIKKRTVYTRKV